MDVLLGMVTEQVCAAGGGAKQGAYVRYFVLAESDIGV